MLDTYLLSTIKNKSQMNNEQYIHYLANELLIETFYGNVIFKWQFEALKCRTYRPQKQSKRQLFFNYHS